MKRTVVQAASEQAASTVIVRGREAKTALVARAEKLVAKARGLMEQIERNFWELGRVLEAIRSEELHRVLGYDNLEVLAEEGLGLSKTVAWKLIAVAQGLPRTEAVKLGQERAYALVAYAKATGEGDDAVALVRRDVAIAGKRLSQTSVRELKAATAAARPKRPRTFAEAAQAKADRALLVTVRERLGAVGVPKRSVAFVGDAIVITLSRVHARRVVA